MRKPFLFFFVFFIVVSAYSEFAYAQTLQNLEKQSDSAGSDKQGQGDGAVDDEIDFDSIDVELEATFVKDPIQPYNRAIHTFNDKFYFYAVKPMTKGYDKVVPEKAQLCVRNFFSNIKMPVRFFNCLFQGKFKGAGTEGLRFLINSTIGGVGFTDPAKKYFDLEKQDEDFGQTLGHYKMGNSIFIEWPFIGPSSVRDTIGFIGDMALNPLVIASFAVTPFVTTGSGIYNEFNEIALEKGEMYETIIGSAIDPYIAVQDSYIQNRNKKIRE